MWQVSRGGYPDILVTDSRHQATTSRNQATTSCHQEVHSGNDKQLTNMAKYWVVLTVRNA